MLGAFRKAASCETGASGFRRKSAQNLGVKFARGKTKHPSAWYGLRNRRGGRGRPRAAVLLPVRVAWGGSLPCTACLHFVFSLADPPPVVPPPFLALPSCAALFSFFLLRPSFSFELTRKSTENAEQQQQQQKKNQKRNRNWDRYEAVFVVVPPARHPFVASPLLSQQNCSCSAEEHLSAQNLQFTSVATLHPFRPSQSVSGHRWQTWEALFSSGTLLVATTTGLVLRRRDKNLPNLPNLSNGHSSPN